MSELALAFVFESRSNGWKMPVCTAFVCRRNREILCRAAPVRRGRRVFSGTQKDSIGTSFDAFAQCNQKDGTLARCVRRKEADYIIVVKGQAGGAEVQSVRGKIKSTADDAGF